MAGYWWPRTWDDLAGLTVLFSFPCRVLPSVIHVFTVPLVLIATAFAWRRALPVGVFAVGLVAFTAALGVGLTLLLTHTDDGTEYPPGPHLGCGWVLFAGAALCSAELR